MMKKEIPVEVYSRVSGYFRPTMQWNCGKKSEFADRKYMKIPDLKEYSAGNRNFREFDEKRILENAARLSQSGIFDKIVREANS